MGSRSTVRTISVIPAARLPPRDGQRTQSADAINGHGQRTLLRDSQQTVSMTVSGHSAPTSQRDSQRVQCTHHLA